MPTLRLFTLLCAIPVLGLIIGGLLESSFEQEWTAYVASRQHAVAQQHGFDGLAAIHFAQACRLPGIDLPPALTYRCGKMAAAIYLEWGSVVTLAVGLSLLLAAALAAELTRGRRALLIIVFGLGLRIIALWLFVLLLLQAAIAAGIAFAMPEFNRLAAFGVVIALGGVGAAILMLSYAWSFTKPAPLLVVGIASTPQRHPRLHRLIADIAEKLGAATPRHVVLGFETGCYATAVPIRVVRDPTVYTGETLYLSLPLMRILAQSELAAVIGHELEHFVADIAYTTKLAPIYGQARAMLVSVRRRGPRGLLAVGAAPARVVLEFFIEQLSIGIREIERAREFVADEAGARATSPADVARALLKSGAVAGLWRYLQNEMIKAQARGTRATNVAEVFNTLASKLKIDAAKVLHGTIAHPTDTHPPTLDRIEALRLDAHALASDLRFAAGGDAAVALLDDLEPMERRLTELEYEKLAAAGRMRFI
jgi:Zn-dependent protease with chaperone function